MRQRRKPWALPHLEKSNITKIMENQDELKPIEINHKFELEIGVGKGDFINNKAMANPSVFYIGIEAQPSVLVTAVMKAETNKLSNIKFILGNAIKIKDMIPSGMADVIYINFPDPWPKARHEKRRLLYKSMLDNFYDILSKNGELILKTDNQGLYGYALESLVQNRYIIISNSENYQLEKGDFPTEYESKFRKLGNPIYRIQARKA